MKLIKKWYFKIYHLLKFLGILLIIFSLKNNVYAEECINLYPGEPGKLRYNSNALYASIDNNNILQFAIPGYLGYDDPSYLKLDNTKTYTFFARDENGELVNNLLYDSQTTLVLFGKGNSAGSLGSSVTFTPNQNGFKPNGTVFMYNNVGNSYNALMSWQFWLVEGSNICTPETNPENDEIYSNFLTLYVDRLNYLANGFTSNKYLIAMIGIIFSWVVLELFLHILHLRGGYKK